MTAAARHALKIDVVIDSRLWRKSTGIATMLRRAVAQAAAMPSIAPTQSSELAIVLTDDSAIRSLNRLWRGTDAATNVLSFPSAAARGEPAHLGDIVLAYETVAREAKTEAKPFAHHAAHLAVHGYLHLVGYDHERHSDAEKMKAMERKVLRRLAIPDPYRLPPARKRPARRASSRR